MNTYRSNNRSRRSTGDLSSIFFIGVLIVAIIFAVGTGFRTYAGVETQTCTVEDKDRAASREGGSDMRVYTEECGTLQVKDVWLRGMFNSADIYADIEVGETYEFTTGGFRIPIFSQFPVILEVN